MKYIKQGGVMVPVKDELYLAHPLDSRKEMREWELEIEKRLQISLINPFYDVERNDILSMDAGRKERYDVSEEISNEIVKRDVGFIATTSGTIAIIDGNTSVGTLQEIVYATILNRYVDSVVTNGLEKHPWIRYHSNKIHLSLKELEYDLMERYMSLSEFMNYVHKHNFKAPTSLKDPGKAKRDMYSELMNRK